MNQKVLILDALQLRYVRRRRGSSGLCLESLHDLGFAGEDSILYNEITCKLYRSIHWVDEDWTRAEYVLVGDGSWRVPKPLHPDCLVMREPNEGEIFDSDQGLLWLAPGHCEELTGTLAPLVFQAKHGEVVGPLREFLEHYVFEASMNSLMAEYGHDIDGDSGRLLIETLTQMVQSSPLENADEMLIHEIALDVHTLVIDELDARMGEA